MSAKAPPAAFVAAAASEPLSDPGVDAAPMFTTETPVRCVVAALRAAIPLFLLRVWWNTKTSSAASIRCTAHQSKSRRFASSCDFPPKGTSTHFFCRPVSAAGAESGASAMSRGARKDLRGGRRDGPRPRAAEETVARGTARRGVRGVAPFPENVVARARRGVASSETSTCR